MDASELKEHFANRAVNDPGYAVAYAIMELAEAQRSTATQLQHLGVEHLAQQLREGLDGLAEPLRSDHPLQSQTFDGLTSALDRIADAIEGIDDEMAMTREQKEKAT